MGATPVPREFDGYELRRLLGRGGMGEVYLAQDTLLDRPVAVKLISAAHVSPDARARFMVEARAVARLQHPNVVAIYRVGEVDGTPYLVSEFVRGKTLDAIDRPVSPDLALKVGIEIARGLAAAHRRGVLHRDIKPQNAILSDDGAVKLLDFGIAKLLEPTSASDGVEQTGPVTFTGRPKPPEQDTVSLKARAGDGPVEQATITVAPPRPVAIDARSLTDPGVALGTPAYMAPEVWRGEPATHASDIYSLGALLYALCSGRPPHVGEDLDDLADLVQNRDAAPLAEVAPLSDPLLCAIVDRCLRRDAELRFQSANDVRSALTQLTPEGRVEIVPEGNPYRGLYPFEAEHQGLFFGRDSEIRMILEQLRADSFVLVAGDSGVGKSSLCRAGVLPRVDRWFERGAWQQVALVPGRWPVSALAATLAPMLEMDEGTVARALVQDPAGVARRLRGSKVKLLIFIDQLEEVVTLPDAEETAAVAQALGWLAEPSPNVRLLATARGDFLSRLAALPRIGDAVSRGLFFLRPLSSERVREVIVGPARVKGVTFEPDDLVEELVTSTVRAGGGGLPLLQFALSELWDARGSDGRSVTREALQAIGGVAGALTRHADRVLARMTAQQRRAARWILLRLVTPDGTRARQSEQELAHEQEHVRCALALLVQGRLVAVTDGPDGARYEIAHEALIEGWATLADWLSSDAEAGRVRERLRLAVAEWERLGGREGLWSQQQLREARAVETGALTGRERAFLAASRTAWRRGRWRRLAAAALVLLITAAVYGGFWLRSRLQLGERVERLAAAAARAVERARALDSSCVALRRRALARFDAGDLEDGERQWRRHRARLAELKPWLGRAAQQLETALMLDPGHRGLQDRFADLLYQRALLAEREGNGDERQELLRRMSLYDRDGSRRARWLAPGHVTLRTSPAATRLTLGRYVMQGSRYRLKRIAAGRSLTLPPGSYLAELHAPGRARVRVPFVVGRRERLDLVLELPPADQVPPGFVYVPPGRFLFGSAAPDGQRRDFLHTVPLHGARTGGYLIARHETTFGEWLKYLEALPVEKRRDATPRVDRGGFQGALSLEPLPRGGWRFAFRPVTRQYTARSGEKIAYTARRRRVSHSWTRLPVVGISAADAQGYVSWLRHSGRVPGARLCDEREWERGARGADGREYPHGEALDPDEANHDATYGKDPLAMGPDEVGSHPASISPFLLQDMAGNVWEWTRSALGAGYAARGGSWYFGANSSRATDREVTEPSFRDASVGLRVCADLPQRAKAAVHAESAR